VGEVDNEGERESAREAQKGGEKKKEEEAKGICELHLVHSTSMSI
jgi:hypothetical protein